MEQIALNVNCMDFMATLPDKAFELAIVDPPYGIDINMNMGRRKGERKKHDDKQWDKSAPDESYFNELFRVSENQIIWGGNYYHLPITKSWIYWHKDVPDGLTFADGELAWTSFDKTLKEARIPYSGFTGQDEVRVHPTQKPIKLYIWLMKNYAKPGDRILDTHLGSGSSRIAAYEMGFDFVGCEIDKDYFEAQEKRWEHHIAQMRMEL